MKALVLGATGAVGSALAALCAADARYRDVACLVRRPVATPGRSVVVDFDRLDAASDAFCVNHVYCALGTTLRAAGGRDAFRKVDHGYAVAAARLAKDAEAGVFALVSSVDADPTSGNFYLRVKGETERDVQALGLARLELFRPSLLIAPRAESRPLERVAQAVSPFLAPLMAGPLRRYRPVEAGILAAAMIRAAFSPGPPVRVHEGPFV